MSTRIYEARDLALIVKVMKGGKKRGTMLVKKEEKCYSNHSLNGVSHVTCVRCHNKGHYAILVEIREKIRVRNYK